MKKRMGNKSAFTLVELIVAIAVLAMLATVGAIAGINIARASADNRNKTATRSYFTLCKGAMHQLNSGTSIYSNGQYTANDDVASLVKSTTGTRPVRVLRLEFDQSADRYRPFASDAEGYYVLYRYDDPKCTFPMAAQSHNKLANEEDYEFFVDAVYYVQDNTCYAYNGQNTEVTIYR